MQPTKKAKNLLPSFEFVNFFCQNIKNKICLVSESLYALWKNQDEYSQRNSGEAL